MKKILLCMIMTLFFPAISVCADAMPCYLEFEKADGIKNTGIVAGFDENGILLAATKCDIIIGNDFCNTEFELNNTDIIDSVRIYFPETGIKIKDFIKYEIPSVISETPETEPEIQKPEPDAEITGNENNTAISRYPTEYDAATAFMMVKSVETVADEEAIATKLTVLFRGEETTVTIPEEIVLSAAPYINYELINAPASELKPGDVIYCSTNMSGKIRTIELIFRPQKKDIVSQDINYGNNFELLFSDGNAVTNANPVPIAVYGGKIYNRQYAFGVIREKKNGYMELVNKSGIADNNIFINITDNTAVYVYNGTRRNNKVSLGTVAEIEKTWISSEYIDDDFNVTGWDSEYKNYALVRMSDGVALDVAVFYN